MGWTFKKGATKQRVISEIIEPYSQSTIKGDYARRTLAYTDTIEHNQIVLWTVGEVVEGGHVTRWIGCYLLDNDGGYGWGYKPMDESMGPFYFSCPLGYLELQPVPRNDSSRDWRDRVRAHHTKTNRRTA